MNVIGFVRCALVLVLVLFGANNLNAASYYVNDNSQVNDLWCTSVGNNSNSGSKASPFLTLKYALTQVSVGDFIYVDAGTYTDENISVFKNNVTISGAGPGLTKFSCKRSSSATLYTFMKITSYSGITVQNVTIEKYTNQLSKDGEALTIGNSSSIHFINVMFGKSTGGVGEAVVTVQSNSTDILFDGISFVCQTAGSSGGGMDIGGTNIDVTINNSIIGNNDRTNGFAWTRGGGLYLHGSATVTVTVNNSTFINNTAASGGAIYMDGGILNMNNSCVTNNVATSNTDYGGAVAIWGTSAKSTFTNCDFSSNSQTGNKGGGISLNSQGSKIDLDLVSCTFSSNTCVGAGTDIYTRVAFGKVINLNATNCTFGSAGTSIYNQSGNITITNCGSPTTSGTIGGNTLARVGSTATSCPTFQGACPSIFICKPAVPGPDKTVICPATTTTLTASGPAGSVFYWYDVASGGSVLDTSSSATPDFPVTGINANKTYYVVSSLDGCQTRMPINVVYTSCSCPNTLSYSSPVCNIGTASPTLLPPAAATYSSTSGLVIDVNTGVIDLEASTPGTYTVKATITAGSCEPTASITINPNLIPSVSVVSDDADNTICAGTSITFTATPTNGGSSPTYQWKLNGANVGTGGTTYTNASLINGDIVSVVMTSNNTCQTTATSTSNTITITVNTNLTPSVSIVSDDADNTICTGTSVVFTATPTNGGSSPTYQWKLNGTNVGTGGTTYTNASLTDGDVVSVVITSNNTCQTTASSISNAITITVTSSLTPSVSIVSDDADNTICAGTSVTFTATPTNGGSAPTYQWKLNGNNVGTGGTTYTNASLINGDVVSVVMTSNSTCQTTATSTSNTITITATTNLIPSVSIVSDDADNSICAGTSVTFTATPINGGSSPTYQWKLNATNVGTGGTTYSNASLANGDVVSVVMTSNNTCQTTATSTSNTITITVTTNLIPSVSIVSNDADNSICAGTSVTFTATPTNGGGAPTYQWKLNATNVGTGGTTYSNASLANGDVVSVVMTSNNTCQTTATSTSNTIAITVNSNLIPSVSIVSDDADNTICTGTSVTFTATPTNGGGAPSYQWKLNATNVGTGGTTYSNASLANGDVVSVVMTSNNTCQTTATSTSTTINFTVLSNSITTAEEKPITACGNADGQVKVSGSGTGVINWTGAVNGSSPVATPLPYIITGLKAGAYTITFNNGTCTASSNISLSDPGAPAVPNKITSSGSTTFCQGNSISLTASPVSSGTVNWTKDGIAFGNPGDNPITVSTSGTYAVTITVAGCKSIANDTTIVVNSLPNPPTGSGTVEFCASAKAKISDLSATGTSIKWYNQLNGGQQYTDLTTVLVDGQTYYASQTSAQGCEGTSRYALKVKITPNPTPTFVAQPGASSCLNTDITYNTENLNTNYVWNVPGVEGVDYTITSGGIGSTNHIVILKWLTSGKKVVTVGYTTGSCASTTNASNETTVNSVVNATFDQSASANSCSSTDVVYTTQSGNTNYIWTVTGVLNVDYKVTSGSLAVNSNTVTLQWLTAGTNTVTVKYTKDGCLSNTATSTTSVSKTPDIPTVVSIIQPTCKVPTGTITFTAQVGVEYGLNGIYQTSPTKAGLAPGIYTITVRNSSNINCVTSAASTVEINAVPNVPIAPSIAKTTQPTCTVSTGSVLLTLPSSNTWEIITSPKNGTDIINKGVVLKAPNLNFLVDNLSPGVYKFSIKDSLGCTSIAMVNFDTIKPQPVTPSVPIFDANDPLNHFCSTAKKTLGDIFFKPVAIAPAEYRFYDDKGFDLTLDHVIDTGVTYYVSYFNGQCESKSIDFSISLDFGPDLVRDTTLTYCAVSKPTFSTLEGNKGVNTDPTFETSWFLTKTSSQAILDKSSLVSAQTYWYNVKNAFGCSNDTRAKVTVVIDKGTAPDLDPKGLVLCANNKITVADLKKGILTNPGTSTIKWYPSLISQTPLDETTDISSFTSPYKFYATLTPVGGCESIERDSLLVSIITSAQTIVDNNSQTFCKNITHLVSDLNVSPNANGSIVWYNKNKQVLLPNDILTEGTYFAAIVNQGCVSDKLATVTVNLPSFKIQTNVLPPICHEENGEIKVLNTLPTYDYTWFLNNQVLTTEKGSSISKVGKGNYKVVVIDNNCPSDTLLINVDCTLPKIPQIITPDNNGKNDYFVIGYYTEYPKVTLSIYNRWGTLVYQSGIPYKDDWDGKPSKDVMSIGTETLPTGTYYYVIDKGNGDPVEYGYLELVK